MKKFLLFLSLFFITPFIAGAAVEFSFSIPTNSQDFSKIKFSLSERISKISLTSPSFSHSLNLNLSLRIQKNQKAVSFIKEETVSNINSLSSKISLVQLEKRELKPKPYLKTLIANVIAKSEEAKQSFQKKNLQKDQEQAFIHESILKNVKKTIKESLPSITGDQKPEPKNQNQESKKEQSDKDVGISPEPEVIVEQKPEPKPTPPLSLNLNLPPSFPPFLI